MEHTESSTEPISICSPDHPDHRTRGAGYCCSNPVTLDRVRRCNHECCRDTYYDRLTPDELNYINNRHKGMAYIFHIGAAYPEYGV